MIEAITE